MAHQPPITATPEGRAAVQHAALWLAMLVRQFPDLLDELVPGARTPAPERTSDRTPAALAALGARIRQERRDAFHNEQQGLVAPGPGTAPLRLHVSDAIRDITDGVVELEEAVYDRLGLGRPRRARVPQRLLRITALLDSICAHPVLAAHVRDEARRMARRCARALGDTEAVVRVPGHCPWCDSVSLRAFPARRAVICVNPGCRCSDEECGCHDDAAYRHLWAESDWAALAEATGQAVRDIAARADEEIPR